MTPETRVIENRIDQVRKRTAERKLDALMVLVGENRQYLSGYTAEDSQFDETAGVLLITGSSLLLTTDSRFDEQARQEAPLYEVIRYRRSLADTVPSLLKRTGVKRVGFEAVRLSVREHGKLIASLQDAGVDADLVPVEDIVEPLRAVKTEPEIEATRKALHLAEAAFKSILDMVTPDMTERELAWTLERRMRDMGAQDISFPVICAAGPNSALPHAIPGDQRCGRHAPLLFDWGARLHHYCSDISRTICLGTPDDRFLERFDIVLAAQQKAIDAIRDGVSSRAVDAVARNHIRDAGYPDAFGHGLGHGTGLAVHEAPRLSPLIDTPLKTGMIVTVEPGLYIPGWGGIRLENQVVVREDGAEVLNALGMCHPRDNQFI